MSGWASSRPPRSGDGSACAQLLPAVLLASEAVLLGAASEASVVLLDVPRLLAMSRALWGQSRR